MNTITFNKSRRLAESATTAIAYIVGSVGRVFVLISEANHRGTKFRELQNLDDRCLKDIGINRSDIGRIVRGDFSEYRR